MKKYVIVALLLGCGAALYAQTAVPADKAKAAVAAPKKTAQAKPSGTAAVKPEAASPAAIKKTVKPAPANQADQDNEESVVMIDSKSDSEDNGRFNSGEDQERTVPGGLPSSYGQCKGTITEGGRTLLVFESAEDGTLSFVQVIVGKISVTWKLVDRVPRSAD